VASSDPGAAGPAPGVIGSLRSLAANAVAIVHTRLELLANEVEEERVRTLRILLLAVIALFCAAVGVLLITTWIVVALWEQYRLVTLATLAFIYLLIAGIALRMLMAKAAQRPKLFSTSLAELARDRDLLKS
jgi:uncharacterized membrane protein YqjE